MPASPASASAIRRRARISAADTVAGPLTHRRDEQHGNERGRGHGAGAPDRTLPGPTRAAGVPQPRGSCGGPFREGPFDAQAQVARQLRRCAHRLPDRLHDDLAFAHAPVAAGARCDVRAEVAVRLVILITDDGFAVYDRLDLDVVETVHRSPCLSGLIARVLPMAFPPAHACSHRSTARASRRPTELKRMPAAAAISR